MRIKSLGRAPIALLLFSGSIQLAITTQEANASTILTISGVTFQIAGGIVGTVGGIQTGSCGFTAGLGFVSGACQVDIEGIALLGMAISQNGDIDQQTAGWTEKVWETGVSTSLSPTFNLIGSTSFISEAPDGTTSLSTTGPANCFTSVGTVLAPGSCTASFSLTGVTVGVDPNTGKLLAFSGASGSGENTATVTSVGASAPEPASLALCMLLAAPTIGFAAWRKRPRALQAEYDR